MLEEKKEVAKKESKAPVLKDYTIIKKITLEKVYQIGSTVSVEVGSELEKKLLTNKFINKYGISRPN